MAPRVSDKALLMSVAYASRRIFPALSFHVKLHMHQLHALASEQINRHGNHAPHPAPHPAGWLQPWAARPAPPSLILPDSFPCFQCGIPMSGQKHFIIYSEGLISFLFKNVQF